MYLYKFWFLTSCREGIAVKDVNGNDIGKSRKAGISALSQVALTRAVTSLPVLLLPPVIMSWADKTALIKNNPRLRTPIELGKFTFLIYANLCKRCNWIYAVGRITSCDCYVSSARRNGCEEFGARISKPQG